MFNNDFLFSFKKNLETGGASPISESYETIMEPLEGKEEFLGNYRDLQRRARIFGHSVVKCTLLKRYAFSRTSITTPTTTTFLFITAISTTIIFFLSPLSFSKNISHIISFLVLIIIINLCFSCEGPHGSEKNQRVYELHKFKIEKEWGTEGGAGKEKMVEFTLAFPMEVPKEGQR